MIIFLQKVLIREDLKLSKQSICIFAMRQQEGYISGDISGTANYKSTDLTNITGTLNIKAGITGTLEIIDQHSNTGDRRKHGATVEISGAGEWTYTPETVQGGNDFFLVKFTQDNALKTETVQVVNVFISPVDNATAITATTSW